MKKNKIINHQSSMVNGEPSAHFESLYPSDSRFTEIEKILKFVKAGNSAQLIGLPGVGRSNILGLLTYNTNVRIKHLGENQKWFHFVLCNFSEIRKKPLFEATKFIFLSLVDSLRERRMDQEYKVLDKIFKESIVSNDELVLFQGLKRAIDFLCIEKELTVVFLFDRFEEYISEISTEFFANLRILRNRAKYRLSVIFSLNRPLEDLIEPMLFADFYEFLAGNTVYLPLLDKPGLDFRISYLEKVSGKQFSNATIRAIIGLTAGHGKLTRLCAEAMLSNQESGIRNQELENFFLEQKSVAGALYEIWYSLNPEEQKILVANQLGTSSYLINVGILKNEVITIPLFASFVKEHGESVMEQLNNEAIRYDAITNEIRKGNAVLSDSLTSSEFKLLKFLLENPDKIIEREEIIKSVWSDAKSIEGVTDQALDQLIFRLRKKIEEDPNNPKYLQTLKGRGIRFIN